MQPAEPMAGQAEPTSSSASAPRPIRRGDDWPSAWAFFAFAFAWSWAFWIAAAAGGREVTSLPTIVLFALGGIGPVISALALTWRGGGRLAARALFHSTLALRRIPARWWAVILGLAFAPSLIGLLAEAVALAEPPDLDELSGLLDTPQALAFIVVFALAAGLAEEPGWRGYALERLRERHGLLEASLVIGALWAVWHFQLYFVEGTFQNEQGFGSEGFWYLSLSILALALLYTWIQRGTGWIVAAAVGFHAGWNVAGECFPVEGVARWITFGVLLALAAVVASRLRAPGAGRGNREHDRAGRGRR